MHVVGMLDIYIDEPLFNLIDFTYVYLKSSRTNSLTNLTAFSVPVRCAVLSHVSPGIGKQGHSTGRHGGWNPPTFMTST